MNDGHSGIKNERVNNGASGGFELTLAVLHHAKEPAEYVIHATSMNTFSSGLQPWPFLQEMGLAHFEGKCEFNHDRCFYRTIARMPRDGSGFPINNEVQAIHQAFKDLSFSMEELFKLRQKQFQIVEGLKLGTGGLPIFGETVNLKPSIRGAPAWIKDVKFPQLIELEEKSAALEREIDDLSQFLPLLFGTGDALEESVRKSFIFLGLKATKTHKGKVPDVFAETLDGKIKFGIEVTGLSTAVKKDIVKITQMLEFEQKKDPSQKGILIASTFNNTPITSRTEPDFTEPVISFLSKHPILLMTGLDLYNGIGLVLKGELQKSTLVEMLYSQTNRFALKKYT